MELFFITLASTSTRHQQLLWSLQKLVIRGDYRNSQPWVKPLLFWNRLLGAYKDKRNKYQPATVFVSLNIPLVRSDFPNLAMRAILEWTPGRAWRQSGKRELHFNDFKPLWKKWKYTEICFSWGPCEASILIQNHLLQIRSKSDCECTGNYSICCIQCRKRSAKSKMFWLRS